MDFSSTKTYTEISRWLIGLITAVALASVLVWSFGSRVSIDGHSMTEILNDGDTVLINRAIYKFNEINRFDIVYFHYGEEKSSVKRIIGLPSETVEIKNGEVYINGKKIDLPTSKGIYNVAGIAEDGIILGPDEYFLLGDNGDSSEDSRFSGVGVITESQIEGKVWFRLSPFAGLGAIESGEKE